MSSAPEKRTRKKPVVRTRTPRPDELDRETFEFITAVDRYKRRHMRSFLDDEEVLEVLGTLGYAPPGTDPGAPPTARALADYAEARHRYRVEHGRLFPTWSEIYDLLVELGYRRRGGEGTAA